MKEGKRRVRIGECSSLRKAGLAVAGSEDGRGAIGQGTWAASRSWKRHAMEHPLEPPEGTQPSDTLILA